MSPPVHIAYRAYMCRFLSVWTLPKWPDFDWAISRKVLWSQNSCLTAVSIRLSNSEFQRSYLADDTILAMFCKCDHFNVRLHFKTSPSQENRTRCQIMHLELWMIQFKNNVMPIVWIAHFNNMIEHQNQHVILNYDEWCNDNKVKNDKCWIMSW